MVPLPRRLNARIILLVSCILLTTGLTSGWITARHEATRLLADMRKHSSIMVRNIAESCAHDLLVQDYADLESFLLKSAELPAIRRLQVSEPDGALVWDIERATGGKPHSKTGIARLTTPASPSAIIDTEHNLLVVWHPIIAGSMLGWLRADISLSAIREAQADTWEHTLVLTTVWVACSSFLIILLLRPVVRSISGLTAFATRLDGHKGEQIAVSDQPLEIAELGNALNEASVRLLSSDKQLFDERELLRKSEENYKSLLDTIQEGIWVIDSAGVTTFVNPRMSELLGYSHDEMIGKHLYAFMDDQGRQIAESNLGWRADLYEARNRPDSRRCRTVYWFHRSRCRYH